MSKTELITCPHPTPPMSPTTFPQCGRPCDGLPQPLSLSKVYLPSPRSATGRKPPAVSLQGFPQLQEATSAEVTPLPERSTSKDWLHGNRKPSPAAQVSPTLQGSPGGSAEQSAEAAWWLSFPVFSIFPPLLPFQGYWSRESCLINHWNVNLPVEGM